MTFSPAGLGRALLEKSDEEVIKTHLTDLDQVLGHGFADSVVEAKADRWKNASPYCFPGRAKLQSTLMRGAGRVFLAGDYLGTLYTESSITTGFSAAQEAASVLATQRQAPPQLRPAPRRLTSVPDPPVHQTRTEEEELFMSNDLRGVLTALSTPFDAGRRHRRRHPAAHR